jgi:hypothetical protein
VEKEQDVKIENEVNEINNREKPIRNKFSANIVLVRPSYASQVIKYTYLCHFIRCPSIGQMEFLQMGVGRESLAKFY